jgi:hypothetical protein
MVEIRGLSKAGAKTDKIYAKTALIEMATALRVMAEHWSARRHAGGWTELDKSPFVFAESRYGRSGGCGSRAGRVAYSIAH